MVVGVERFDLRIPACSSLKEKRHVVKGLTAGIRQKFNVSVAEVDHHELWQRTTIAVSVVSGEAYQVRKVLQQVERYVATWPRLEFIDTSVSLHDPEDEE
jgi:uncharacterized protein YlxP (DUF503 family)